MCASLCDAKEFFNCWSTPLLATVTYSYVYLVLLLVNFRVWLLSR